MNECVYCHEPIAPGEAPNDDPDVHKVCYPQMVAELEKMLFVPTPVERDGKWWINVTAVLEDGSSVDLDVCSLAGNTAGPYDSEDDVWTVIQTTSKGEA